MELCGLVDLPFTGRSDSHVDNEPAPKTLEFPDLGNFPSNKMEWDGQEHWIQLASALVQNPIHGPGSVTVLKPRLISAICFRIGTSW